MGGFLSLYDGTQRLVVGTSGDREWEVVIKEFPSAEDYALAQRALLKTKFVGESPPPGLSRAQLKVWRNEQRSRIEGELNSAEYQHELVVRAIVSWNLTDEQDAPLPISKESLARLPQRVFNMIYEKVNENTDKADLDEEAGETEADFPGKADQRDPDGGRLPSGGPEPVRNGSALVSALGGDTRDAPLPAIAGD